MTTPHMDTLCPGCFVEKGRTYPCPLCGYDERAGRGPLPLPHRTLLQGQFGIDEIARRAGSSSPEYAKLAGLIAAAG